MTKYKRRSQAEWQGIIQRQKASGLNVAAFCQQQGLSSKTFYKRRRGLHLPLASEIPASSFIKITKPVSQMTSPAKAVGVLHYPNSQLHIQPGCDVQWLAKLMQALS